MTAATVIALPRSDRVWTWALLPAAGAALGGAVYALRGFWLAQDWLPWRGPAEIADRVASWFGGWALPAFLGVGIVAGVVLVLVAVSEEVTVTVADDRVRIEGSSSVREHRAADVREALVDGKHLVLVADNGADLSRTRTGLPEARLAEAFRAHGYRWIG